MPILQGCGVPSPKCFQIGIIARPPLSNEMLLQRIISHGSRAFHHAMSNSSRKVLVHDLSEGWFASIHRGRNWPTRRRADSESLRRASVSTAITGAQSNEVDVLDCSQCGLLYRNCRRPDLKIVRDGSEVRSRQGAIETGSDLAQRAVKDGNVCV
jgi:hypothetical protein